MTSRIQNGYDNRAGSAGKEPGLHTPERINSSGKDLRMGRIIDRDSGNLVIVPLDHGMSIGPAVGLYEMGRTVDEVARGGATAVVMHKGLVRNCYRGYNGTGLIVHLSASTGLGSSVNEKRVVTSVHEAMRRGADAVSVHLNVGADTEADMLHEIGMVSGECEDSGMPLLVMAYPRGPKIKDPFDPEAISHAVRVAAELGADVVKCNYTGDIDSFRDVVRGAMVPVVIAGGPKMDSDKGILKMVYDSLQAGGRGVSMGRNIFQHHDVCGITRAISDIIKNGATVQEAFGGMKGHDKPRLSASVHVQ